MALPPTNPPGLVRDAEDLNKVINGDGTTNRAGDSLPSIKSIIGAVEDRRDSAILAITQAESDVQQELQDAIARTGYNFMGDFADGGTLESRVDALRFDGEWYRWDGALPKTVPAGSDPESEGGIDSGAWRSVGDAALRQELGGTELDKGAVIIRRGVVSVNTIADLLSLPSAARRPDLRYTVASYHAGYNATVNGPIGGGEFVYDESLSGQNDGGYILDGFLRVSTSNEILTSQYGADQYRDSAAFIQAAIDRAESLGGGTVVVDVSGLIRVPCESDIFLKENVTLRGSAGRSATRLQFSGMNGIKLANEQQCWLEDIRVYGDNTAGSWGVDIVAGQRGFFAKNVYANSYGFKNNGGGFRTDTASFSSRLTNCAAERCGRGFLIQSAATILDHCTGRQLQGVPLEIANSSTVEVLGGNYEKNSSAFGGDDWDGESSTGWSIIIRNCRNISVHNPYMEQSASGNVLVIDSTEVTLYDPLAFGTFGIIEEALILFTGTTNNSKIIGGTARGLDGAKGPGVACIKFGENTTNCMAIGVGIESDGSVGAGNREIIDLGTNNTIIGCPFGDGSRFAQVWNGSELVTEPFVFGGKAKFSALRMENFNYDPDGTKTTYTGFGNEIGTFEERMTDGITQANIVTHRYLFRHNGQAVGRQCAIDVRASGSFGRNPGFDFLTAADSGDPLAVMFSMRGTDRAFTPGSNGEQNLGSTTLAFNINYLKQVRFEPVESGDAINNSLFVDSSDGRLSFKNSSGVVSKLALD